MTHLAGNRLIVRALERAGYAPSDVDMSDLNNPATQVVQQNLYVRQPFVELGKTLLEDRLSKLQANKNPKAIEEAYEEMVEKAKSGTLESYLAGDEITNAPMLPGNINSTKDIKEVVTKLARYAKATGRKFVPFAYLGGENMGLLSHISSVSMFQMLMGNNTIWYWPLAFL